MDKQAVWDAVQAWPRDDQIDFVMRLWDHIADSGWQPEMTEELKAELDRRWANFQANPDSGLSWERVIANFKRPR